MPLALIVDCSNEALSAVHAAREALEDRGWETLLLRRDPEALVSSPAELLARAGESDLTLTVDAPDRLVRLVRASTATPLVAARLGVEERRDRLVC